MICEIAAISLHLQSMGFTAKLGAWVPHLLTQKQRELRLSIAAQTHDHRQPFSYSIVTEDEKLFLCENEAKERVGESRRLT